MKNIAKKITAIIIAFTIIGTNSAIFNSVPVYNRDCSVVHAADKKHVEKNNEKSKLKEYLMLLKESLNMSELTTNLEKPFKRIQITNNTTKTTSYMNQKSHISTGYPANEMWRFCYVNFLNLYHKPIP